MSPSAADDSKSNQQGDSDETLDPAESKITSDDLFRTTSSELVDPEPTREPLSRRRRWQVEDLVDQIKQTADKLAADGRELGDLKILSRTLRELRYALKVFGPYRSRRKATVFGSARTKPDEPAYQQAVAFGKAIAASDWMVVTGAAFGIMEAGHVGAGREKSMGLGIMLPFEQSANPIIDGDEKLVMMKYFFTRKLMLVKECDAVVCLPGGFGTLDEAMEVITLLQTGKRDIVPVVLLDPPGGTYWKSLERFMHDELLKLKLISPDDFYLFKVTDNCQEAIDEVLGFFRVYHSMRYVGDKLVLRLQQPLSDEKLAEIRRDFAGIVESGTFEQQGALPAEQDDTSIAHLTRLVFQFDRHQQGRLRRLIDVINGREQGLEARD